MYKVMFATLLAAGLFAAPLTYSSAARAQQPSASEKTAKTNKEQSAGQLAARERQKIMRSRMERNESRRQD